MGRAKDIIVKVIPKDISDAFCKRVHYSGTVAAISRLHLGVFLDGNLHGVMQFGSPIDKRKVLGLVKDTNWNDMLELNRMAFDDYLPKNSESRALSIAFKLIKKNAPNIRWILSFADGAQCGDGTIYRASGFALTQIHKNGTIWKMPDGQSVTSVSFSTAVGVNSSLKVKYGKVGEKVAWGPIEFLRWAGGVQIPGFQLRYIYLIDKEAELTVPIIPFEEIDKIGAGMYKGENITIEERNKENGE